MYLFNTKINHISGQSGTTQSSTVKHLADLILVRPILPRCRTVRATKLPLANPIHPAKGTKKPKEKAQAQAAGNLCLAPLLRSLDRSVVILEEQSETRKKYCFHDGAIPARGVCLCI